MPRDTTIVESAKQRSLRVPLDHYARPSRLAGAKWWLSGALGMAAAIYVGWLLSGGFAAQLSVSPGPVASVHATWNDDCQACHQNFQPLRADAVNLTAAFLSNTSRDLADAACLKCHNEPPHHANEKSQEVPSCSACHREHQGSAANIVRPDDHRCLNCHLNIDQHRNGPSGLTPITRNVTGFAPAQPGQTPHPDFRSLAEDPGNIKFNHWLHLQPGIAVRDAKHKLRYRDLPRSQLSKSASNAGSDDLVQLDCSACHQPAADQGSYMQPIRFEQHCQACHPLELKTAESLQPVKVPHGLSGSQLSTTIDGLLFAAEQRRSASVALLPDESGELPLIPGKTLGRNLAQKIGADLLAHRTAALQTIDAKCQQCHYPDQDANREKADAHELKPASIPSIWLKHARFDHTAHRHVECRQCHMPAFAFEQRDKPQFVVPPTGGAAALDDSQVMIVGLESCASCHAPASGVRGGARHDCAECHNYHADSSIGQAASLPGLKVSELAWFPGSTLSTHFREASAAPAHEISIEAPSGSFAQQAATSTIQASFSACASAGCHGDVQAESPAWKTALSAWAAHDPHAQAYDVLWTYRAREMTRLLSSSASSGGENNKINDQQHFALLQQRCVGCHASPAPVGQPQLSVTLASGVTCQACHGPAHDWLHTHYRTGFSRTSAPGFIDTKNLMQRAGVCLPCHVGPSNAVGITQVVDHDLIAAGHPRLAFDFHSYFESLPAHWDRAADTARHQPGFHFRSWLAGQTQQAEQQAKLTNHGESDFSRLDCFACHHQLAAGSERTSNRRSVLEPATWPAIPLPALDDANLPAAKRLALARELMSSESRADHWENALRSYLAVRAVAADFSQQAYPQAVEAIAMLKSEIQQLGNYLGGGCFQSAQGNGQIATQYDSPTAFSADRFREHAQRVGHALENLERQVLTASSR